MDRRFDGRPTHADIFPELAFRPALRYNIVTQLGRSAHPTRMARLLRPSRSRIQPREKRSYRIEFALG